jgi:sarcosine oxidase delta subunit
MRSMSFVLTCPHCGVREVADFAFGGELSSRPRETPTLRELCEYNYFRRNVAGVQRER